MMKIRFLILPVFFLLPTQLLRAQTISTIAGTPTVYGFSGVGGQATAAVMKETFGVAVDNAGNIYTCDFDNEVIWKINSAGTISIYAGNGVLGYIGDGGPATAAELYHPAWLRLDNLGNLYFFDQNNQCVRKIDPSGIITTIVTDCVTAMPGTGDGGPVSAATFCNAVGFVPDNAGNFYITDVGGGVIGGVVRKVNSLGIITTVVGNGTSGFSGDGGPAIAAQLKAPYGVSFDGFGNMYIPDVGNYRIRKVDAAGIITTVAGNGTQGSGGDGGPALNASFYGAWQVAFDHAGNMYIDDAANNRVRKVDLTGTISAYAGTGAYGYSGDGGPATAATLTNISGIALDNGDYLYIADEQNYCIRKVNSCRFSLITQHPVSASVCTGAGVGFSVTAQYVTSYQWQVNTGGYNWTDLSDDAVYSGTATSTLTLSATTAALNGYQYHCLVTNACGSVETAPATLSVNDLSAPAVAIAPAAPVLCSGAPATFTATPTNGGPAPVYQWLLNGGIVGTSAATYANSSLVTGDQVSCVLTSNSACATSTTATSNVVTMTVDPTVTPALSITADATTICSGTLVSFTAAATDGGGSPVYQWMLNGGVVGTNSAIYTNASLTNRDVVSCVLTNNDVCTTRRTAGSNVVVMTVNPMMTPALSIATDATTICSGTMVLFTADATGGGASPVYQWQVNGMDAGTNSGSFSTNSLADGDVVSCVLTGSVVCATAPTAVSNPLPMKVEPVPDPAVTVAASTTTICSGATVAFTASEVDGGTSPSYQWQINGQHVGGNEASFSSSGLANGDVVSCLLVSSLACSIPVESTNSAVMTVNATPTIVLLPDTIIGLGASVGLANVVVGPVTGYQWTPVAGLDNPAAATPVASPLNTTTYFVTVSTSANCTATGKVTIGVFKELKMPGAFTPNGDGNNDLFRIPPSIAVKIRGFVVYNRWGGRVFMTSNPGIGWDGTVGGKPQPAGTYAWEIEYDDLLSGKIARASGTVLLVR